MLLRRIFMKMFATLAMLMLGFRGDEGGDEGVFGASLVEVRKIMVKVKSEE